MPLDTAAGSGSSLIRNPHVGSPNCMNKQYIGKIVSAHLGRLLMQQHRAGSRQNYASVRQRFPGRLVKAFRH